MVGEILVVTGMIVLVPSIILGTTVTLPAVVGAGVIAAGMTGVQVWYERQRSAAAEVALLDGRRPHPAIRLWAYARPHRLEILAASACSIFKKVFDLAPPVLVALGVDIVNGGGSAVLTALGIAGVSTQLWFLAGLTVLSFSLESLFEAAYKWLWRDLAQKIQHELRLDAYSYLQRLSMSCLEEERTGHLAVTLKDNINQLEIFIDGGTNAILELVTNVIVVTLIFAFILPGIGWLALVPIPLLIWGSFEYQRRITPLYSKMFESGGALGGSSSTTSAALPRSRATRLSRMRSSGSASSAESTSRAAVR